MVLKRLFGAALKAEAPVHFVPEGQRVYAIGDIHGRLDLLDDLLGQIGRDDATRPNATTSLVFLGDLVDRGPDSRGVIERLMALRGGRYGTYFLLGNHEEVFLKAVMGDVKSTRFLTRIGGRETIASYGVTSEEYNALDFDELAALLGERVPRDHVAFLQSLDDWIAVGDYLFVHAGIRPGVATEEQVGSDLRWIRDDFLSYRDGHDKMVIHGHNITPEVDLKRNRIGIDTGAYASGKLTAIGLEGGDRWFLQT
jgi:serine/threonine protein phosphatase 1